MVKFLFIGLFAYGNLLLSVVIAQSAVSKYEVSVTQEISQDSTLNNLNKAIESVEGYVTDELYSNDPNYLAIFAKYFVESKGAKILIKDSVINELSQDDDMSLLPKLYTSKAYTLKSPKDIIYRMITEKEDSIGAMVVIGLHSEFLDKKYYNKLFLKLGKQTRDKYGMTHLYYGLKMIEKHNKSFLTPKSIHLANKIERKYLPLYLVENENMDIRLETLAFLTEFKNPLLFMKDLEFVLNLQNNEGGFSYYYGGDYSNLHTSVLALWYLLNLRNSLYAK